MMKKTLAGIGIVGVAAFGLWFLTRKGRGSKGLSGYDDFEDPRPSLMRDDPAPTKKPRKRSACMMAPKSETDGLTTETVLVRTGKGPKDTVSHSMDACRVFRSRTNLPQERLLVAHLNNQNVVEGVTIVAQGGVDGAHVDPKDVLRPAIISGAPRIILAHNHPSGSTMPSQSDAAATERVRKAAEIVGIGLLDHIIVPGQDESVPCTSFRDLGLLQ